MPVEKGKRRSGLVNTQAKAAEDLEAAAAELERFIETCADAEWYAPTVAEGWTRAAVAFHCALGNDVALAWICEMLDWRPVGETPQTHNAANAADAQRHSKATKQDVLNELRRSTARTAAFLRSLTDEELQRSSFHGLAAREMTVGRFIRNFGGHILAHLESLRRTA
jgi:uncharacterized protein (TIGR03083 family)